MHRLQLIKISIVLVIAASIVSVFLLAGPIRFMAVSAPGLSLSPLGFSYDKKPFTGAVYQRASTGRFLQLTFLWRGKRHGADIQWFGNGRRSIERHYRNGLEVGTHKAWYQDGSVKSLKVFADGVAHGKFYDWHSNGRLAQFVIYEHGREVAAKSWTAGGKPFYNYVWNDHAPIGVQGDRFCSPKKK